MALYVATVDALEPGMAIGQAVFNSGTTPLVVEGTVLSWDLIASLRKHGITQVMIRETSNRKSDAPILLVSEERKQEGRRKVDRVFSNVLKHMRLSDQDLESLLHLVSAVVRDLEQNNEKLLGSLEAISNMDKVTYDHCWSVAVLSLALYQEAVEAAWLPVGNFQDAVNVGLGAVLHDIGKLCISPDILNKTGPLNEAEWEEMRLHSWYGAELLRSHPNIMPMVRGIVLHHHQRMDGTGYGPRNKGNILSGEDIPRVVRLVTVADMYDALASDRPYRPGLGPWEVLRVMAENVGSMLDPIAFSLLEQLVVPFPPGCFVLFHSGDICIVTRSGRSNRRTTAGEPWARVLAMTALRKDRYLGDLFKFSLDEVLFGASSVSGIVLRMVQERKKGFVPMTPWPNPREWLVHHEWKNHFVKAFSKAYRQEFSRK